MDKPKTLVSETKSKTERNCDNLRTYAEPSEVRIFKMIDGKLTLVATQPPTYFEEPKFNNGKKKQ